MIARQTGRLWVCVSGALLGVLLAGAAAWSLWGPRPGQDQSAVAGPGDDPVRLDADSAPSVQEQEREFEALFAVVRDERMRDQEAMGRLLDLSAGYVPTPKGGAPPDGAGPLRRMATRSLAIIAKSWIQYGALSDIEDHAIRSAVRWSVDEDSTLRANCATVLLAVQEHASGGASGRLSAGAARALAELRADPEVQRIMNAQLAAWRGDGGP